MKKVFAALILGFILVGFSACEDEVSPVEISIYTKYNPIVKFDVPYLNVTSVADSVTIKRFV